MSKQVRCPYCRRPAKLVGGAEVYPTRRDLFHKLFWACKPCEAWVGCHEGTDKPLGILANKKTREARIKAHAIFDKLWQSGVMTRKEAYVWLSGMLGIPYQRCHISCFGKGLCKKVVRICNEHQGSRRAA